MLERLNRTLGTSLRALLNERPQTDWDLVLPQIMRGLGATPHTTTGETANYMMMGREVRLPDAMTMTDTRPDRQTVSECARDLQKRMGEAGEYLRSQQKEVIQEDSEEPNVYMEGDLIWLKSYWKKKGENPNLAAKYIGPYRIIEVLPYHTYKVEREGNVTIQHEGRIRLHMEGRPKTTMQPVVEEYSVPREQDRNIWGDHSNRGREKTLWSEKETSYSHIMVQPRGMEMDRPPIIYIKEEPSNHNGPLREAGQLETSVVVADERAVKSTTEVDDSTEATASTKRSEENLSEDSGSRRSARLRGIPAPKWETPREVRRLRLQPEDPLANDNGYGAPEVRSVSFEGKHIKGVGLQDIRHISVVSC